MLIKPLTKIVLNLISDYSKNLKSKNNRSDDLRELLKLKEELEN